MEPHYSYTIKTSGLSNFTNNNTTLILIPVPMVDDKPLFNEAGIYSQSADWSISPVDTEYGKMLALKNNQRNLSDINIEYSETIRVDGLFAPMKFDTLNKSLTDNPLHPNASNNPQYSVFQELPVTYSADHYHWIKNYSSDISIDKNIRPITGSNNSIEIKLYFLFARGVFNGYSRGGEWAGIHELIPQDVTGYIPVNISIWESDF